MTRSPVRVGIEVEVLFEGLPHVWFPASIIEDLGNNQFLVEYQCLGINNEAEIRKDTVDLSQIRLSTPPIRDKKFVLLEKVDAFYDFGWWTGIITKKLADSRYIVYFRHTNKEREVSHLELRLHVDNNLDSSAVKKAIEERASLLLNIIDPVEDTAETSIVAETSTVAETSIVAETMKMKRTKVKSAGSNDKHSKPSKKLKTGITSDDEKLSDKGKSKEASNSSGKKKPGKKGKVAELNSPVTTSERRKGKSPIDYKGTKIISPVDLKKKTIEKTSQKASQKTVQKEVNVKKRDPLHPITCVMGLQCKTITDAQVKKVNSSDQNPQKDVEAETPQPAAPLKPKLTGQSAPLKPKLTGQSAPLTRKLTGHSAPLKPKLTGQSAPLSPKLTGQSAPLSPKLTGNSEVNESDTVISLKRKRGRPAAKKKRVAPVKVNNENGDAKGKEVVLVGSPKSSEAKKTTKPVETAVVSVEKTSPLQQEKPKSVKGKRGKRRKISSITVGSSPKDLTKNDVGNVSRSLNEGMLMYHRRTSPPVNGNAHSDDTGSRSGLSTSIAHLTRDRESSWKQKPNGTTEKDSQTPPVEKSLDTISDDQPLSRWIEGILPTTTTTAVTKKPTETPKPKPPPSFPKGQNQPLSFEKRSTLWSTLELMPLFKQIPQNPHFHPLNTEKECTREGQAISKMVTFFRVVEATSQLNIENPKSLIEDNLEALMELEPHGFDVKAVKDRLAKLLILKGKKEKLEEQSRKLKEKMEVEKNEGQKIDKEIELVEKQVVSLLEKRAQVLAKKEKKDLEVGKLEAEVDGVKMGISETREKFVGLVGAEFVSKNL